MDSTFYEKFYKCMTPATFRGMASATPDEFEFSVKVPETVTHDKKLDVSKGAITLFEEFLEKISPLKNSQQTRCNSKIDRLKYINHKMASLSRLWV